MAEHLTRGFNVTRAMAVGSVTAEVLPASASLGGGAGGPVRAPSAPIDSTCHRLLDVSAFANRPVRLRFHLRNGRLYAFWVSPSETGASRGYLAAGSLGRPSIIDKD